MRKGSTIKERNSRTTRMIGKKERAYSTSSGSLAMRLTVSSSSSPAAEPVARASASRRRGAKARASSAQISPVANSTSSITA